MGRRAVPHRGGGAKPRIWKLSGGYGAMVTLMSAGFLRRTGVDAGDALFEACYLPSSASVPSAAGRYDGL